MGMDLIKHLVPPIERRSPTKYKSLATKTICCGRKFDLLGDIVLEKHTVVYFIHHHKLFLLIFYENLKKNTYILNESFLPNPKHSILICSPIVRRVILCRRRRRQQWNTLILQGKSKSLQYCFWKYLIQFLIFFTNLP